MWVLLWFVKDVRCGVGVSWLGLVFAGHTNGLQVVGSCA